MKRLLGLVLAVPFALAAAGPASAYQIISEVGPHGNVWLDDTTSNPAGICHYGPVVYANWAYLKWMKVKPPHVFAADRNSDNRDQRLVSWQWNLQRKTYSGTTWKVIKHSAVQKRTAYEDQQASFSGIKLFYNSENEDRHHTGAGGNVIYRAVVIVKWFKPNGTVESTVRIVLDWFKTETYWAAGPSNVYCQRINTDG